MRYCGVSVCSWERRLCLSLNNSMSRSCSTLAPTVATASGVTACVSSPTAASSTAQVQCSLPRRPVSLLGGTATTNLTSSSHQCDTVRATPYITNNRHIRALLQQQLGSSFERLAAEVASASAPASLASLPFVANKLLVQQLVTQRDNIEWLDISSHPTAALEDYRDSIAATLVHLGAHETLVEATLEGVLLPQTTIIEGCQCLVVRCAVEDTSYDMDSIQELTNRLTILVFQKEKRVVTVHRTRFPGVNSLQKKWNEEQESEGAASSLESLVLYFVKEASRSFHRALGKSIVQFDNYEAKLFAPQRGRSSLARQIYHIKRRASVYSRILALTQDAFIHFVQGIGVSPNNVYVQDVVQDLVHVRSLSDELNDNSNSVLQLLFQLSSYQLNELMRVLTMFSAFFIPLSFIASVYGMNFDGLPGLNDPNGHWYCLTVMLVVGLSIVMWFKLKKFW